MQSLLFLIQLCLFKTPLGNTVLPPTWRPRAYGECIPTNTGEGVGYPGNGKTCNFAQTSMQPYLWHIYKDGFVAAASQDLYNGFHTQDNFISDCDPAAQTENVTDDNCGQNCGVCFMVSGPIGSTVFLVQEIADINAVQNNGRGLNLHLNNAGGQINYVRTWSGVELDLTWKRIPCPVCGGIYIWYIQYNHAETWQNAIFFTIINHRIGVKGVWVRHGIGSSDRNWYRLPKQWTNQYRYEAYGSPKKIAWMPSGPIHGSSTNNDFDLKIVSHVDEEIICIGLTVTFNVSKETQACLDANDNPLQFSLPNVDETPCNTTIAYHDNTNCPTSNPTNNPVITSSPTSSPSQQPSTEQPSLSPITSIPSQQPSSGPPSSSSPTTSIPSYDVNTRSCASSIILFKTVVFCILTLCF